MSSTITIVLSIITTYFAIACSIAFWGITYRNKPENKNVSFVDSKAKMLVKCVFWVFYVIYAFIELFIEYQKDKDNNSATQPNSIPNNNKGKKERKANSSRKNTGHGEEI